LTILLAAGCAHAAGDRASVPEAPSQPPPPPRRLVLISWDGAADWVIDRLLAEGALPNLAALAARGVAADYSVASYPTKTAASHAVLWTGCWAPCNGVAGNSLPAEPRAEHTPIEAVDGVESGRVAAEPLWIAAARAGRTAVVLSATQTDPPGPVAEALAAAGAAADRLRTFNGFRYEVAPGEVIGAEALGKPAGAWPGGPGGLGAGAREAVVAAADSTFYLLAYDDPGDPVEGLDTLIVRQGDRDPRRSRASSVLKPMPAGPEPQGWSRDFTLRGPKGEAGTFFRLFELAPDGSRMVLYRRRASALGGFRTPADLAAYRLAYPGFHDDPFLLWEDGALGTPLPAGGDGTAERRAVELVAFDTRLLISGTRFALDRWRPDLLVHYSPQSDHAGHAWIGMLDPAAPGHDPALAARLWPFYAAVFAELDRWLGAIVEAAPPETVVAVVSDHGMAGVKRLFYPNRALEEAGLLVRDGSEGVDLSRTRALAPRFGSFTVAVNDRRWRGGIVAPEEREEVLEAAAAALLAARDPATGEPPVARVLRPGIDRLDPVDGRPGPAFDSPGGGDLYFDLAHGYYPSIRMADAVAGPQDPPWGSGEHGYQPARRVMHAIFYAAGPGLGRGVRLGPIRHVDVAPTLTRAAGLPAPADAEGRVVTEALAGE
jgi:predicted AlkP superfamily phosphohydrolase/phosphomutase